MRFPEGKYACDYNDPSVTELAVIITGDENATNISKNLEVIIKNYGCGLETVPSNHISYNPLSFVLSHMHSEKDGLIPFQY